jgi:hypothetical protein
VGQRDRAWALAAGALAGASATVRALGVVLVAAIVIFVLATPPAVWWQRLARAGAATAGACVLIGSYMVVQHQEAGFVGLTRAGGWNLYARAATFADCDRFTPPKGTRVVCEDIPEDERTGPNNYLFDYARSPAVLAFGTPFNAKTEDSRKLGDFARQAIIHQPLDWLRQAFTEDLPRYVVSDHRFRGGQGLSFDDLQESLVSGFQHAETQNLIGTYYSTHGEYLNSGRLDAFRSYERGTRVTGVLFVLLALPALASVLAPRELRRGGLLFGLVALVGILGPPLSLYYDARYAIPAFGPLASTAAVGGAALTERVLRVRAGRRGRVATQA